ncbi:MAG: PmoA family protein [Gemmataceae bacterium]|nr:PmoA family protein [Gemmataceae bacterium]
MSRRFSAPLAAFLVLIASPFAAAETVTVTLTAAKATPTAPICVPLTVPKAAAKFRHAVAKGNGVFVPGQLTVPSLVTEGLTTKNENLVRRDLWLRVPALQAGAVLTLTVTLHEADEARKSSSFVWHDSSSGQASELVFVPGEGAKSRPVLRYMAAPYDDSSPAARERTYKVFHHLFDPTGTKPVTNGAQADAPPGEARRWLYPHHRGLMFGFSKCSYGEGFKKKVDTWHCPPKGPLFAYVQHEKVLAKDTGPVLGRHRVQIGWHGENKEKFVLEERELTAYDVPGGTLVEFASRLKTTAGPVKLDGDPQHAGFQFRASNEVAEKTAQQTYYLHPDGKGGLGKERNWPQDKTLVDLPWYCMSFVLDGQRYSVCLLNHPHNPKETRFSERAYGRFGGYFEYTVTPEAPLLVNYRLWLQEGEMTAAQAQALYHAFAGAIKATVR